MHPLVDAFWQGRDKCKKKVVGKYFDNVKKPKLACHLGAVYYGLYHNTEVNIDLLHEWYPEIRQLVPVPCTDTGETVGWISSILIHLNDAHDGREWSDKKVAAWLGEGIEWSKRNMERP